MPMKANLIASANFAPTSVRGELTPKKPLERINEQDENTWCGGSSIRRHRDAGIR
jgi:hypothetical protein